MMKAGTGIPVLLMKAETGITILEEGRNRGKYGVFEENRNRDKYSHVRSPNVRD